MGWDGLIGEIGDFLGLDSILDPGKDDRRRALQNQEAATDMWLGLNSYLPSAQEIDTSVHRSALPSESRDASYAQGMEAQRRALAQMQGIAGAGGYTDLERGQIRQAQQQAAQYERSQRQAALQQMQARGMSGSGAELASRLQAQQSGANRAANDATNIATAAQQRALQAMQASAQQGASLSKQQQERGEAINAFNRANSQARGQANQQAFQNRANVLAGATGQYNANANSAYDQANQQAAATRDLISTVVGAVA